MRARIAALRSGVITCRFISLGNQPGAMLLTHMLSLAHSTANPRVMPQTAALLVQYGTTSENPRCAAMLLMLTMRPLCALLLR